MITQLDHKPECIEGVGGGVTGLENALHNVSLRRFGLSTNNHGEPDDYYGRSNDMASDRTGKMRGSSWAPRIALLFVIATLSVACSSNLNGSQLSDASTELPIVDLLEDEDGPSDLTGMVAEAQMVFEAQVVAVEPEFRYYGPTSEAPDTAAFEQVGLVLEPTNVLKGNVPETLTIRWTSYQTEDDQPGSPRLSRVSVQGLVINEQAQGERFGIFIQGEAEMGVFDVLTASGIVPLDAEGQLSPDQGATASFLYGDWIGDRFEDMVASAQ